MTISCDRHSAYPPKWAPLLQALAEGPSRHTLRTLSLTALELESDLASSILAFKNISQLRIMEMPLFNQELFSALCDGLCHSLQMLAIRRCGKLQSLAPLALCSHLQALMFAFKKPQLSESDLQHLTALKHLVREKEKEREREREREKKKIKKKRKKK
jgi:hypothetical protein